MNDLQFDVWTRRRIGLTLGGFAASLFGLIRLDDADAGKKKGKKKRKKRCKKVQAPCHKPKQCCGTLLCDHHGVNSVNQTFCCKAEHKPCSDQLDCCTPLQCFNGTCEIVG